MQAAGQLAQLGMGLRKLPGGQVEDLDGLCVVAEPAPGDAHEVRGPEQALLGTVVQVTAEPPALCVGHLDDAPPRRLQRGLLTAALELGGGARREDPQSGELLLVGLHRPRVEDREVAEMRPVAPRRQTAT